MDMRYEISDWKQLSNCMSNNSRKLHIHVSVFVNSDILTGTKIEVCHDDLGVLYASVLNAKGNLVSAYDNDDEITDERVYQETTAQVLMQLAKYGFNIVYKPVNHLPKGQLEYLKTVKKLGYDKLRILSIWDVKRNQKRYHNRVIVFNADRNPQWLNADYSVNLKEFNDATLNGSAAVVSVNNDYDWSWLFNFVANIDDIIKDNEGTLGGESPC